MNFKKQHVGFNVTLDNDEKIITYIPASFPLWIHALVIAVLGLMYFFNLFICIIGVCIWLFLTIRSKQKNELFISKNKILVGNDSINLNQITGFILSNALSDQKINIALSDVIRTDELINKVEIDEFLSKEKFGKAFQISMVANNTVKKLVWNLSREQAKSFIYYFSQGQYLIDEDESDIKNT